MWLVTTTLAFVAAIAAHAGLSRVAGPPLNMVTRFVAPGVPIGVALLVVLILGGSSVIQVVAGLLCYALACEVYLFVFTMITSSISVSLLLKLRNRRASWAELDAEYSESAMVDGRMAKLVANGLMTSTRSGFTVTTRGEALVRSFDRLRRFFRHPGFEPQPGPTRTGRVEAQHQPAGRDVG
ncbi:MAG: hypothetical protein M3069_07460 [Chloroflexota bacterium]|nr:hypothetical protein [Chloroflexota bacterium]